ncbi:HYR domain-containing protein [Owenweeksia hongkongensis DSM 17368]|uniref:HYR domain-containing protein n=1 Tax=Owenweeksia hongkongensis (strain DSM 17368 / CIP 108786 / JCM 12287 / NRRL B-23963 / UST20020801) TaxID=926562 RepID=G8R3J0_OWEHD|nr:HYR domain-containing protein [Owenweeksia hongkongensis]AEV33046.1 HYR domain-containing protein [Owenweeksia hongkongensis DSM 17368]
MKHCSTPGSVFLQWCHSLLKIGQPSKLFTLLLLLLGSVAFGHGVLVGYQIGNFPNGNNTRVWIEHWHGHATSVSSYPLQYRLIQNGTPGALTTTYATGYSNGVDTVGLQQANGDIVFLPGACGSANTENNWVYWDFNLTACGNNVVDFEIIAGTAATTEEGCASLYPQTITGVNVPGINAPDVAIHTCPPYQTSYSIAASDLSSYYTITALCDPNPTTVLNYMGQTWTEGTTPVPNWSLPKTGDTVGITVTDNTTGRSSHTTFMVSFKDAKPPRFLNFPSDTTIYGDANCQAVYNFTMPQGVDGCTGTATVSQTAGPSSGSTLNFGNTVYSFKVSDAEGNDTTASFTVSVADTSFNFSDVSVQVGTNGQCNAYVTLPTISTTNNCGSFSIYNDRTYNTNASGTYPVGTTTLTWYVYSYTTGKQEIYTQKIIVVDNEAPTISTRPATVTLDASGNGALVLADVVVSSSDNCGVDSVSLGRSTFSCDDVGIHKISVIGYDIHGNQSIDSVQITVVDTISPVIQPVAQQVYLDVNGNAYLDTNILLSFATDACLDTVIASQYAFTCTNLGQQTVNLTATDETGNTRVRTLSVTTLDTVKPSILVKNVTTYLNASGSASINATFIDNGTADACGLDTIILSKYDFDCGNVGANTITFTAKDVNNNSISTTAIVTVVDTVAPTIQLPITPADTVEIHLDASGNMPVMVPTNAFVSNGMVSDSCGIDTAYYDIDTITCTHVGYLPITVHAKDINGNSSSLTFHSEVFDTVRPTVVTQNHTVYLNASGNATITTADIENGSTDACGVASFSLSETSFGCSNAGANTVYLSVIDVNGNVDSASATVTVLDTISPEAKVQSITAYLDASGVATVTATDVDNGSSDNCTYTLSLSQTTFDCTETGLNLKTFTVTDASGNKDSKDAWITIKDTISPELHLYKSITVSLDQFGNATIAPSQLDSASTDNCSNLLFFTVSKTKFNCSNLGSNTVTVTAHDNKNNSTAGTAIVIVKDYQAPVVVTQNITAYLDGSGNVSVLPTDVNNGTTDNCTVDSLWLDKDNFSCADMGQNIVKLYAKDQSGNVALANAVVTVVDTISPMVSAQNITVYLDANGAASITTADINNGSTDNCAIQSLSLSKTAFDCSDVGANTVTFTAVDASANSTTAAVTVTVMDTINPTVVTQNITVSLDATGSATIAVSDIDNGSSDNCGVHFSSLDITNFDCTDLGANTVTLTVLDNNGNSKTAKATVSVEDNTDPTVITQDISVYLDANGAASITVSDVNNGSFDNCAIQNLSLDKTTFDCSDLGVNTVTLTGVDGSLNSASVSATVTVIDTISPLVYAQNHMVYLDANGAASITTADINNGSTDNCAIQSLSLSKTAFDCSDVGANTVTFTAVDASANSTAAAVTVTVMDTINPTVVTQNITVSLDATGSATIAASDIDNGSSDACGIQSMSLDVTGFTCTELGANTVTLTVTDNNSNVSVKTATVTVVDNVTPIMATQNITIYLGATGNAAITPSDVNNGSTDNCGITTYSLDISTFDCADLGQNLVILSATDASNNTGTKSAFVTVLDTIDPAITNLPATITAYAPANQCAANVQWPAIIGSDNCGVSMVTTSKANGALFQLGTTVVNVTVTDASSNTISQSFNVVVVDTVAPSVSNVPTNYTVIPNTNSCDAVVNWIEPVAIDNCGGVTWTKSHLPGATFPVGNTTVTYTATDSDNNATTVSFVVTVTDQVAPVVSGVPANITVSADAGSCDATVSYTMPAVSDNCSGAVISSSHASGSVFPIGTTTVTFTATDGANNVTTASFTVTVEDKQSPIISSMPANDTVGSCGATYTYAMPVATDNCSNVSVVQTSGLPSGSIFPAGITVNTFKISDANGNDTVVSFTLVVVPQGMPNLPSLLEICANMPAVELSFGQNMVWSGKGIIAAGTQFDPAAAGAGRHQLSYVFTDGMGCDVSGSISVTVLPQPIKPVVSRIGSTTLSTGNYNTYQWYRDGVLIPGATNQNYAYNLGGNYQVMVTNNSGCENYSHGMVVGQAGGGIGIEENLFGDLDLYPNPSNGVITIDINRNELEELSLVIFNTAGKMVYELTEQTSYEGKLSIDLSHLPDATYMLRITSGGEVAVKRVVIY